jgi:Rrf2 family protein
MLKLTKKSDYGLIALRHLAVEAAPAATAKEIAENYRLPVPLLAKVLQRLAKDGFLISEPGASGGYRLARDPRLISTLEVIRSIDGPVLLASCFHSSGECEQDATCTVKEPLRKVHEGILRLLSSISIWDLATGDIPEFPNNRPVWPIRAANPARGAVNP